jgi:probable phosphoglycerate mutase
MSALRTIYLIRHGETAFNRERILQTPDVPLSEEGVEQARALARRLAGAGIQRILSSDLERAVATTRELAAALGAPVHYDALLQERNFGDLRGSAYRDLGFDPFATDYVPPRGESVPAFEARVARAWDLIQLHAAELDGPLAVVTHGLVCRALVTHHLAVPLEFEPPDDVYRFANCSLTIATGPPWIVRGRT